MLRLNIIYLLQPGLLCWLGSILLNRFTGLVSNDWPLGLVFFLLLCGVLNIIYALKAGKNDFTGMLVVGIVIRLLFSMVLLFVYFLLPGRDVFFNFSIHFILQYVWFTIFEIGYLRQLIKIKAHKS